MGDPPLVVGHNENVELETQSAEVKAELRAHKEEVRVMIEEMEKRGRDLSRRKFFCAGFQFLLSWPSNNGFTGKVLDRCSSLTS